MVRLSGEHALHVIIHVAQHEAKALGLGSASLVLSAQRLHLKTLKNRDRKLGLGSLCVREDEPGGATCVSPVHTIV